MIYVTTEGLARKKEEFRELMEVKLPDNFEAIGKAAAFGDLSENAEYTSALEERDHLTRRATQIKEELDKAQTLGPELVQPGVVGLGSRVRLLNVDTQEEVEYSLLGPLGRGSRTRDAELSFAARRDSLMGHSVGEEVECHPAWRVRMVFRGAFSNLLFSGYLRLPSRRLFGRLRPGWRRYNGSLA